MSSPCEVAVGNVSQITNTTASETSVYGYDALDRLTSWTLNNGTPETYGYDSATGNLASKAGLNLTSVIQIINMLSRVRVEIHTLTMPTGIRSRA